MPATAVVLRIVWVSERASSFDLALGANSIGRGLRGVPIDGVIRQRKCRSCACSPDIEVTGIECYDQRFALDDGECFPGEFATRSKLCHSFVLRSEAKNLAPVASR